MKPLLSVFFLLALIAPRLSAADVFDRQTAPVLQKYAAAQQSRESLGLEEAARLKSLSPRLSTPAIVVRTGGDNWAKALVAWGFHKGPDKPIPVLLIERYVTYRGDRGNVTAANGGDVMLFAGFEFDFDIGQVVPQGHGGDVTLTRDGLLKPLGEARLYALNGPQLPAPDPADRFDQPTTKVFCRAILPALGR